MRSILAFSHIFTLLHHVYPPDYILPSSLFTTHNTKRSRSQNRCLNCWKQVCFLSVPKLLWNYFLLEHRQSMGCLSHVRPARSPRCKGISLSLSSTVFLFFLSLFLYLLLTTEGPSLLHFTCRPKGKRAAEKRS